ncbi:uncharacterized protein C8Q71DRAFT_741304 [Rhodofomes roseus]|uniref:Secreted protein n=1 Tax=Rhodofomes roseus TaxID=34475 RepID=A0ABQ8KQA1_9APHY|nr:uncharacterized protein C8Q71DRAFT_741304 [Rhodofomes roseus]KAH9840799.1 hypothetical protein C8Q71DRAFT_741304 [Rhodofomes roseus]
MRLHPPWRSRQQSGFLAFILIDGIVGAVLVKHGGVGWCRRRCCFLAPRLPQLGLTACRSIIGKYITQVFNNNLRYPAIFGVCIRVRTTVQVSDIAS